MSHAQVVLEAPNNSVDVERLQCPSAQLESGAHPMNYHAAGGACVWARSMLGCGRRGWAPQWGSSSRGSRQTQVNLPARLETSTLQTRGGAAWHPWAWHRPPSLAAICLDQPFPAPTPNLPPCRHLLLPPLNPRPQPPPKPLTSIHPPPLRLRSFARSSHPLATAAVALRLVPPTPPPPRSSPPSSLHTQE